MFLLKLIMVLGLTITFTETPELTCNTYPGEGLRTTGCYMSNNKEIVLSYYSPDINKTLYHEIGHAIFLKDNYSRIIIKSYKPLYYYPTSVYDSEQKVLNEIVADYFALFMMKNKEFSVKYPVLWIYFNNKLNNLTN